jgi:hypothetical protein
MQYGSVAKKNSIYAISLPVQIESGQVSAQHRESIICETEATNASAR